MSGALKLGKTTRVDECLAIRSFEGRDVFKLCRRVIVPERAVAAAEQLLPAEARAKITVFKSLPSDQTL